MCEPVTPAEVAAMLGEARRVLAGGVSEDERAAYMAWKASVFARLDALAAARDKRAATSGGEG